MPQNAKIQKRRGTAAQWASANPVLDAGEPAYETDTGREKTGDGTTAWSSLPYSSFGASPDWSANTPYRAGQVVVYQGTQYRANSAFTSGSSFSASNWTALGSATYEPVKLSKGLGKLYAGLGQRQVAPCRIAFAGSSTTAGFNASAVAKRYTDLFIAATQAAYPSGGAEAGTQASTSATFTPPASPGVQGFNAGIAGTTAANYLTPQAITNIAALNPRAVVHMIGSNDFASNVDPATYRANVAAAVASLKSQVSGPCVQILVQSYERFDSSTHTYPWSAYGAALKAVADADPDNVVYVDLSPVYYGVGIPSADPLDLIDTDNIHQRDPGHALMADLLRRALGIPGSTSTAAVSGSPQATLAVDTFTRTDAASLGNATSGQAWDQAGTSWAIASGKAHGGASHAFLDVAAVDIDVSLTTNWDGNGGATKGISFRADGTSNRLVWYIDASTGNLLLAKVTAGSLATLVTAATGISVAVGVTHQLRVVAKGSTISGYLDGALIASYTLTSGELATFGGLTKVGIRQAGDFGTLDNFQVLTAA